MRQVGKDHFLHMELYPNSKEEPLKVFRKCFLVLILHTTDIQNVEWKLPVTLLLLQHC